jgi:bidirectional [NiFe] hydrogenase diaphorase subunit
LKNENKVITIEIDGIKIQTPEDSTILDAALKAGIFIPTLCHHEKLKPYGACRLCLVELSGKKSSKLVASCGYNVEEGMIVSTKSEKVLKLRKLLVELLYGIMPESKLIQKLAKEFHIIKSRYHRESTYCINCGLCVRYCNEVAGHNAVNSIGRGENREIAWIPLSSFKDNCEKCMECMFICPTGVFPSNWGIADNRKQ